MIVHFFSFPFGVATVEEVEVEVDEENETHSFFRSLPFAPRLFATDLHLQHRQLEQPADGRGGELKEGETERVKEAKNGRERERESRVDD